MQKCLLLILLLFTQVPQRAEAQSGVEKWKLEKKERGIEVFSRLTSGSSYKEIKVVSEIQGTIAQFYALFTDVKNYDQVIYNTRRAYMIEQPGPFEFLYYTEIKLPWPASNRDMTIRVRLEPKKAEKLLIVKSENQEDVLPENESIVRIPYWRAEWYVRQSGANTLSITYYSKVDPGGNLSPWIVNMAATEAPVHTFTNLEKNLKLPRYQDKKYPFLNF